MDSKRVVHRISGQRGTLESHGIWYSSVRFDGEQGASWVANDSLRPIIKHTQQRRNDGESLAQNDSRPGRTAR